MKCRHRRLSLPVSGKRSCLRCGVEFQYDAFTLTDTDRQQAAAVVHNYDPRNIRNQRTAEVVRPIRRAK